MSVNMRVFFLPENRDNEGQLAFYDSVTGLRGTFNGAPVSDSSARAPRSARGSAAASQETLRSKWRAVSRSSSVRADAARRRISAAGRAAEAAGFWRILRSNRSASGVPAARTAASRTAGP